VRSAEGFCGPGLVVALALPFCEHLQQLRQLILNVTYILEKLSGKKERERGGEKRAQTVAAADRREGGGRIEKEERWCSLLSPGRGKVSSSPTRASVLCLLPAAPPQMPEGR